MFNFFRREESKLEKAANIVANNLSVQMMVAGGATKYITSEDFALGYIFGFFDASFQAVDFDQEDSMKAMRFGFMNLWNKKGEQVLNFALDSQDEQTFIEGMVFGGEQAFQWLSQKKSPMGLTKYLLKIEKSENGEQAE
jgi:hypothetical protein